MQPFNESRFRAQVTKSLSAIRNILDNTRHPTFPADVQHTYSDKFGLAEFLTNTSIASGHECLAQLGLTGPQMRTLVEWSSARSVSLRFTATERCSFLREVSRKVESASVVTKSSLFGKSSKKIVTTVTEWFWRFEYDWTVTAVRGTGATAEDTLTLRSRKAEAELMTTTDAPPRVASRVCAPIEVSLSWILAQTSEQMTPRFRVDRSNEDCRTPRRNPDVEAALSFWAAVDGWALRVADYLRGEILPLMVNHGLDIAAINDDEIFMPIVALFEEQKRAQASKAAVDSTAVPAADAQAASASSSSSAAAVVPSSSSSSSSAAAPASSSALLPIGDANRFLSEQRRTLGLKSATLAKTFPLPSSPSLISSVEASLLCVCAHLRRLASGLSDGVGYIESMLRAQLLSAVGRDLTAFDFAQYMRFHYRKTYRDAYEPRPFAYAVRRPEHAPEGLITVESTSEADGGTAGQTPEPVLTHVRHMPAEESAPMRFALDASTSVTLGGSRYLHGLILQRFSGSAAPLFRLSCRARQYSSFLVLVGTIGGPQIFAPKHAIQIKNKDDLQIPLDFEVTRTDDTSTTQKQRHREQHTEP